MWLDVDGLNLFIDADYTKFASRLSMRFGCELSCLSGHSEAVAHFGCAPLTHRGASPSISWPTMQRANEMRVEPASQSASALASTNVPLIVRVPDRACGSRFRVSTCRNAKRKDLLGTISVSDGKRELNCENRVDKYWGDRRTGYTKKRGMGLVLSWRSGVV